MSPETIMGGILVGCMLLLAILILIAIVRSVLGPKIADRIVAINMIGTMTIVIIAFLSVYLKESYLADVCLIYAMISFLAVVVLTKVYTGIFLEKKGIRDEFEAIEDNLEHQMDETEKDEGEEEA